MLSKCNMKIVGVQDFALSHQYYAPLTIDKAGSTASQSRGRYHRHCMLDIIILLPSVSDLQP